MKIFEESGFNNLPMEMPQIAHIAAKVLYLNEDEAIDVSQSLFDAYRMSWLDFVDFACELQAAANKTFDPEQLWPINTMRNQARFYQDGAWTAAGHSELARIFDGHATLPPDGAPQELNHLFSVAFVAHRLRAL